MICALMQGQGEIGRTISQLIKQPAAVRQQEFTRKVTRTGEPRYRPLEHWQTRIIYSRHGNHQVIWCICSAAATTLHDSSPPPPQPPADRGCAAGGAVR